MENIKNTINEINTLYDNLSNVVIKFFIESKNKNTHETIRISSIMTALEFLVADAVINFAGRDKDSAILFLDNFKEMTGNMILKKLSEIEGQEEFTFIYE